MILVSLFMIIIYVCIPINLFMACAYFVLIWNPLISGILKSFSFFRFFLHVFVTFSNINLLSNCCLDLSSSFKVLCVYPAQSSSPNCCFCCCCCCFCYVIVFFKGPRSRHLKRLASWAY